MVRLLKIAASTMYIFLLTAVGFGFNSTYAYFNTLARTPTAQAVLGEQQDILSVNGSFDHEKWLDSGNSGLFVTNVSPNKVWVYFSLEGDLGTAVGHINPVPLKAGESYEVLLNLANAGDLELLDWKNNKLKFSGDIVARVLNNYCQYTVGSVELDGDDIYHKMVREEGQNKGLADIRNVKDISMMLDDLAMLTRERDKLLEAKSRLELENEELVKERNKLLQLVDYLKEEISNLKQALQSAREQIEEAVPATEPEPQTPENETDLVPEPGTGSIGDGQPGVVPVTDTGSGNTAPVDSTVPESNDSDDCKETIDGEAPNINVEQIEDEAPIDSAEPGETQDTSNNTSPEALTDEAPLPGANSDLNTPPGS